jgi:hypothetical protein
MVNNTDPCPQECENKGDPYARPTARKGDKGNGNYCKRKQEDLSGPQRCVVLTEYAIELLDSKRKFHRYSGIRVEMSDSK